MTSIDLNNLIGLTILKESEAICQRLCARILCAIIDKDTNQKRYPDHIKFLCEVDSDTADDIYISRFHLT
jgi:hypothetical protein